jgi:hypothetical protein
MSKGRSFEGNNNPRQILHPEGATTHLNVVVSVVVVAVVAAVAETTTVGIRTLKLVSSVSYVARRATRC